MDDNIRYIVVALVTGLGTWLTTRTKSRHELEARQSEAESTSEGIYVQNMEMILTEYKEQVSGFREEVSKLREENKTIKREFQEFKKHHYQELEEYKDLVGVLEVKLEDMEIERDDWKEKFLDLKGAD